MYTPSDKQKIAILNMGRWIGLDEDTIETYFGTKEDFQKYFEDIKNQIEKNKKKVNKQKNFKKALKDGKIDLKEMQEKRIAKIINYYSNPQILKQKGLEYHFKFSTSKQKLRDWMLKKTGGKIELVNQVLETLIINEDLFLKPKIQYFIKRGLNDYEIEMKLLQKGFEKENIIKCLQIEKEEQNVVLNPVVVNLYIKKLLRKGQSPQSIKYEIQLKFNLKDTEATAYLSQFQDQNIDGKRKIEREINKLKQKGKNDYQIMATCLAKKMDYKLIQEILEELK